jgi:hypothetical protein
VYTFKKQLGIWKTWNLFKGWLGYLLILREGACHCFYKVFTFIAHRIPKFAQMSLNAVLHDKGRVIIKLLKEIKTFFL